MRNFLVLTLLVLFSGLALGKRNVPFVIDERLVCHVKRSCLDCIRLPQCSWCGSESKCFSKTLLGSEDYCKDNATHHIDYGMSLEDNAKCACLVEALEQNCRPAGVADALECSNRGRCECGRCVCDAVPDEQHPSKTIMGEYCEFDNYSCDSPRCNEGPYNINQLDVEEPVII